MVLTQRRPTAVDGETRGRPDGRVGTAASACFQCLIATRREDLLHSVAKVRGRTIRRGFCSFSRPRRRMRRRLARVKSTRRERPIGFACGEVRLTAGQSA